MVTWKGQDLTTGNKNKTLKKKTHITRAHTPARIHHTTYPYPTMDPPFYKAPLPHFLICITNFICNLQSISLDKKPGNHPWFRYASHIYIPYNKYIYLASHSWVTEIIYIYKVWTRLYTYNIYILGCHFILKG